MFSNQNTSELYSVWTAEIFTKGEMKDINKHLSKYYLSTGDELDYSPLSERLEAIIGEADLPAGKISDGRVLHDSIKASKEVGIIPLLSLVPPNTSVDRVGISINKLEDVSRSQAKSVPKGCSLIDIYYVKFGTDAVILYFCFSFVSKRGHFPYSWELGDAETPGSSSREMESLPDSTTKNGKDEWDEELDKIFADVNVDTKLSTVIGLCKSWTAKNFPGKLSKLESVPSFSFMYINTVDDYLLLAKKAKIRITDRSELSLYKDHTANLMQLDSNNNWVLLTSKEELLDFRMHEIAGTHDICKESPEHYCDTPGQGCIDSRPSLRDYAQHFDTDEVEVELRHWMSKQVALFMLKCSLAPIIDGVRTQQSYLHGLLLDELLNHSASRKRLERLSRKMMAFSISVMSLEWAILSFTPQGLQDLESRCKGKLRSSGPMRSFEEELDRAKAEMRHIAKYDSEVRSRITDFSNLVTGSTSITLGKSSLIVAIIIFFLPYFIGIINGIL